MLDEIEHPEIFVGIVAPVGVDTTETIECIRREFEAKGYKYFEIKVTDAFPTINNSLPKRRKLRRRGTFDRIRSYIKFGNYLRQASGQNGILAASAVESIFRLRVMSNGLEEKAGRFPNFSKRIFVIKQFKRPEEIELLRKIYGPLFFQVSVYSRRETRIKYLAHAIRNELSVAKKETAETMAIKLVSQDENEAEKDNGQRVAKIFHAADFIVNVETNSKSTTDQVHRFAELLFGSNIVSPTKIEYGMYAAKVAALRTLDLSRQVGAAIFSSRGEIISMGSNEVPRGGGGTYWADNSGIDAREYTLQVDSNDERKMLVARELYQLATENISDPPEFDSFVVRKDVQDAMFMDALEYGRIVHAEMSALMDAARIGLAVKGASLFTTTFPCHMCAKHIVAGGVDRVVYLEPYPKSLVSDMHSDSISVDGSDRGKYSNYPATRFEHFWGITPRRYREFFERGKRKEKGTSRLEQYSNVAKDKTPTPIVRTYEPFYFELEKSVIGKGLAALESLYAKHR